MSDEVGTVPGMTEMKQKRTAGGATVVLAATAIAGIAGYLVTIMVADVSGPENYAGFAVFWSAFYLVIGALSGIQQEITRASRPAEATREPSRARTSIFALATAAIVLIAALLSSPLWVGLVFPAGGWPLAVPFAIGAAFYVIVAALCGTMYGLQMWWPVAMMIGLDGLLRLVFVGIALILGAEMQALTWAVVLPFAVVPLIVFPVVVRRMRGNAVLDVGYGGLTANVLRTVVAAISTGIMVSGFPLLLSATSPDASPTALGVLFLVITLTRAPLVIVFLSMQSFLIVFFRHRADAIWKPFIALFALILAASGMLAGAAYLWGASILVAFFGPKYLVDPGLLALLLASAGFVALLCLTGPVTLARGMHSVYTAGWVGAAAITIGALLLPLPLESRVVISLMAAPIAGVVVHLGGLLIRRRSTH